MLVSSRMASLEQDALLVARLAVCLGARFQMEMLQVLYDVFRADLDGTSREIDDVVSLLLEEQILLQERKNIRWMHDKIQGMLSFWGSSVCF